MEVYGVYRGQILTEPPEYAALQVDLETFASEELARQCYDTYTKRLIDIDGVLMGRFDRLSGVILITKMGYTGECAHMYRYNDHQDELGRYLGAIIVKDPL